MITIIIPFYNTEKYFNECLSSIRAQTFSDFECLLIDDGSTDSSRLIAQNYVKQDSRFKILNNKHIGYPACKNLGLDKAQGEYICFIDSDDFVEKYHLENLYQALISTNSDVANCNFIPLYDNKINYINEIYDNNYTMYEGVENILRQYFTNTYPWNKLFKIELFKGLRFRNVEALSDTLLNHLIFERAKRTVYTEYKGYHYRIHNESITYNVRNKSTTYWPYRLNVYIEVCLYISKYPKLKNKVTRLIRNEWNFCLPHLTEKEKNTFKSNPVLQNLLNRKEQ